MEHISTILKRVKKEIESNIITYKQYMEAKNITYKL